MRFIILKRLSNIRLILLLTIMVFSSVFAIGRKRAKMKIDDRVVDMVMLDEDDYYPDFVSMWHNNFYGVTSDKDSARIVVGGKLRLPKEMYSIIYTKNEHYFLVPNDIIATYDGDIEMLLIDPRCFVFQAAPPVTSSYNGRYRKLFLECHQLRTVAGELNLPEEDIKPTKYVLNRYSIESVDEFVIYSFPLKYYNMNREFLFCQICDGKMVKPIAPSTGVRYLRVAFPIMKPGQDDKDYIPSYNARIRICAK